ncbi:hypothetical protein COV93_03300 [Candidatus Woesearchaeota archaeon CG11_big_fil_rev_8_21_14_0_20_43_8]|nr:MAG: hypothetical protein COV93_03300 [Candidatus Woesearchaeota archaeon CG11_big_fil_rev_8_21_14_0_20_43_8]
MGLNKWLGIALVSTMVLFSIVDLSVGDEIQTIPYEEGSIDVFFCPRDGCGHILGGLLDQASDIECALFDLGLENIEDKLRDKGADVITDIRSHSDYGLKLSRPGYMHNKFCILNNHITITGSFNPTENGDKKNNNNLLVIDSRMIAQNYLDEFYELKSKKQTRTRYPKINLSGTIIENYFCPEDDCEGRIHDLLLSAVYVRFMTFSFTSEKIGDALLVPDSKGVFEKSQAGSQYSQYSRLNSFIDLRKDTNPNMMHHKVFILDNQTVITGSTNPTQSGFHKNDENVVIIHDPEIAKHYMAEFDLIWGQSLE